MFNTLQARILVILAALAVAGGYLFTRGLKLGLDLQGGMHLALEVDDPDGTLSSDAKADLIERAERIIRTRIDEFGVEEPLIQRVGQERLIVELAGISDENRAKDIIQQSAFLEWKLVLGTEEIEAALPRIDRQIVAALGEDALREMGRAVEDEPSSIESLLFGGDSAGAQAATDTAAAVDTAAAADQAPNLRPFTSLLARGDQPGTYLVESANLEVARRFLALPEVQRALPRNATLQWGWEPVGVGTRTYYELYVLERDAFLTGEMLDDAVANRDPQYSRPIVVFELNRRGGRSFARVTGEHIGDRIAIVLDNEVVSAPTVQDRIGQRGQIDLAGAPMEEARDLALVLRAGALPAPLRIIEERRVGPSLGQDSIDQGKLAGIVGIALVIVMVVGYYRLAGVLAVGALAVYVVLVLGGLAGIGATLTLPGIAGMILSIGMAVDANVLIFERIREELDAGRTPRLAVDEGFAHALSAIVDANVTTLITALILFQFGTGPVQGFAVTLSIGILASFFSAIYVTRTFFLLYMRGKRGAEAISI
ncbi:MAG: protein translocase subunit SecD [Gemmatimonadetes bacterium]|nr:protein translocase subunit SecD [Gemmatimonadota bacterium]